MAGGTTPNKKIPSLPDVPISKDDWIRLRGFLTDLKGKFETFFENPDKPDQVTNVTATAKSGGIEVSWNPSNRATNYIVYRALDSIKFSDAKEAANLDRADALSFFDAAGQQTAGLTRTYWVLARNNFVDGPLSAFATAIEPAAGAGTPGGDSIPILLPNHVTDINLAATGSVTTLETVPSDAYACAPLYLRNEGTAGNWLISVGGLTPSSGSYSFKLGPGNSTLSTMGEAFREANVPVGTIKAYHDNPSVSGHGNLAGFVAWNDGTSPLAGPTGPTGQDGGFKYKFNTGTSGDPGSGYFLFNNATFASATQLNISETDANSNALATFLTKIDDSTSTNKVLVMAIKQGGGAYYSFYITAALTDAGAYDTYPITPISSSGVVTIDDIFHLNFALVGDKGTTGNTGATGDTGQDGGLKFLFNTGTSGDPGSGKFLFNNATFASATQLNISETDNDSNAVAAFLAAIDDSTSTNKLLVVAKKQGGAAFFSFFITAALTDAGTYDTYPITPVTSSGSVSNNDIFHFGFAVVGDKGTTGATGGVIATVNDFRLAAATGVPIYAVPQATPSSTDTANETVTFTTDPLWVTGTMVTPYTTIGGLTKLTTYFIRQRSANLYSFHTTMAGAVADTGKVNLTASITVVLSVIGVQTQTLYLTPFKGQQIALYNGSSWDTLSSAEVSLAVGTLTSGKIYDVFAYSNSGTLTLAFSAAWTSDMARNDAIAQQDGVWVKSSDHTRRYIGTVRTVSTTEVEDSYYKRFLWNLYNQVPSKLFRRGRDADWTYNSATIKQANSDTNMQVEVVVGLPGFNISLSLTAVHVSGNNSTGGQVLIGEDSTTAAHPDHTGSAGTGAGTVSLVGSLSAALNTFVPLGYHYYTWLEKCANTNTVTFGGSAGQNTGFTGWINA